MRAIRRTFHVVAVVALLAACGAALGCSSPTGPSIVTGGGTGGSTGGSGGGGGGGIPNFIFGFTDRADSEHQFFFFPDPDGAATGKLTGNENIAGGIQSPFDGTFTNLTMDFTIHRAAANGGNIHVTGRFVATNAIELTFPNNAVITVDRVPAV